MLSLKNKKVIEFYKTHTNIDFETANLMLVELLEKLIQVKDGASDEYLFNCLKKIDTDFNSLTETVKDIKDEMKQSSQNIVNLQTTISTIPTSMTNDLSNKLTNIRESYVKDLERIFETNKFSHGEHIEKKLKTSILDSIQNMFDSNMNEKTQVYLKQFENSIKLEWHNSLKEMERTDSPKSIVESFNTNLQSRCDSLQHFILQCHDQLKETNQAHGTILTGVQTYFERQKSSTYKGIDSELKLESGLNTTFPDASITNTTGQAKAGDFLMERSDKPTIMIENKDYSGNVPIPEIEKFLRDVEHQSCHGILISQKSGISRKQNFQMDIHNGYIVVYIHNVNYDFDKIRLAIDALDHLVRSLKTYGGDNLEDIKISQESIKEINNEYQKFLIHKNSLSETIKTFSRDMTKQISLLEFPELSNILSKIYSSTEETLFKCEYCKIKVYKNAKALAGHVKKCKNEQQICVDTQ
jgi:hypothetical protein